MKGILKYRAITDIDRTNVYLSRWSLRLPFGWSIKLHKLMRADDDRCHHDHPWWMLRVILWGGYVETIGEEHKEVTRRMGSLSFCKSSFQHRIVKLNRSSSWSLVLTGKKRDNWGFYTSSGWMGWREFVDAARSARVLWCSDGKERGQK